MASGVHGKGTILRPTDPARTECAARTASSSKNRKHDEVRHSNFVCWSASWSHCSCRDSCTLTCFNELAPICHANAGRGIRLTARKQPGANEAAATRPARATGSRNVCMRLELAWMCGELVGYEHAVNRRTGFQGPFCVYVINVRRMVQESFMTPTMPQLHSQQDAGTCLHTCTHTCTHKRICVGSVPMWADWEPHML
eukprot:366268-Chlamydomonas_euryale.AAC.8